MASQKRIGWGLDSQEDARSNRGELRYIGRKPDNLLDNKGPEQVFKGKIELD